MHKVETIHTATTTLSNPMKKLLRPLQDAMHARYEKMTFYKTPRGRSRKVRRYENVDLSKEFEVRAKKREERKRLKLEELY